MQQELSILKQPIQALARLHTPLRTLAHVRKAGDPEKSKLLTDLRVLKKYP